MASYVVVNVDVKDREQYREYNRLAPESIERFGGRYLARGGRAEKLEGGWEPKRFVVLEFPSYEKAKAWWSCAEYESAKGIRQRAASTEMILVEGLNGAPF
ncbi:MAG: DUF1330 domain-containing protein [Gemmatimonadales bacterium]